MLHAGGPDKRAYATGGRWGGRASATQEVKDTMERLRLPHLFCPFVTSCSRDVEAVERATLVWARRHGLITDAATEQRLRAVRIGALIGRVYAMLARHDLQLLVDWTTWGFVWDDLCSAPPLCDQPAQLQQQQARLAAVLRGEASAADQPLIGALADLRQRFLHKTSVVGLERFVRSVEQFFEACLWEATNRAQGRVPDLASYQRMRPYSSGVYTYTELFGIIDGPAFPAALRAHPTVERLTLMANNVVCWINDIVSLAKELEQGDVHNLVVILQHEQQIGLQEALNRAAALVNAEVRRFITAMRWLPVLDASGAAALERYLTVLRGWMRGSLEWSYTSGRYLSTTRVTIELPEPMCP